jgi:tRNA(Ile)-lysidine synthase
MSFSAAALRASLLAQTPPASTGYVLALSGGLDSACLATAYAQLPDAVLGLPLRAVHVDHGLQAAAVQFRMACSALCERLGFPLTILEVMGAGLPGESIEAAARDARYAALGAQLNPGECLLTAHHRLDQAETVLLQLLRGSGVKGLSAMPPCRPLGAGWHLRPLLDVAHRELAQFAADAQIEAVHDPMNDDPRFDRVYLRTQIWPLLERRWPGAAVALSRVARHAADAQGLLDESAARVVQSLRDGDALSIPGLRVLPPSQQLNALRYWIAARGAETPPRARLEEGLRQCIEADEDQQPTVRWGDYALRRYRQRLFLTAARLPCVGEPTLWTPTHDTPLLLSAEVGRLDWYTQCGGLDPQRLPASLVVRRREGGETLKPRRRAKTQSLQHLCQATGVRPWLRDALPLIYAGESLVAVGDLWLDARWCVAADAPGLGIRWLGAPILV